MAPLSYSEEILVTRSDLDEKNTVMAELRNKVPLLSMTPYTVQ
jgi:hypothetical protein